MRTCEVHVHVPAHSESIALQSEVHEGTLVYSLKDRIHMRWAHPVPHATERMHTCQCACVHTRAHRVPRTFSSCMWLQQCTRFCRCTLDFRGFCNGVHEMCTMRGVGSSVMQTTFLQARLPRVRSLTEKQDSASRHSPIKHPKRAKGDGGCPANPNLISHPDCLGAPPARKHATGACCVVPRCAPR